MLCTIYTHIVTVVFSTLRVKVIHFNILEVKVSDIFKDHNIVNKSFSSHQVPNCMRMVRIRSSSLRGTRPALLDDNKHVFLSSRNYVRRKEFMRNRNDKTLARTELVTYKQIYWWKGKKSFIQLLRQQTIYTIRSLLFGIDTFPIILYFLCSNRFDDLK